MEKRASAETVNKINPPLVESKNASDEFDELVQTLPSMKNMDGLLMYNYKGFWCPEQSFRPMFLFQKNFQAHDTDILVATLPKSGTTWLKALVFSTVNRFQFSSHDTPLRTTNPHQLVPFFEFDLYRFQENPHLEGIPSPRLFSTHIPYLALPQPILDSGCRIVYLCRNPLDHFISLRHFMINVFRKNLDDDNNITNVEEAFKSFCNGIDPYGPFWEHVLGYWKASLENQKRVLFFKYEDLKKDLTPQLKKLADFLGLPFSAQEEQQGVIEEISRLCSFQNLKDLEVNRSGKWYSGVDFSHFFRKGEVGDWVNHLTPEMADCCLKIMQEKLEGSGLTFGN